ncbi:hypothetical protein Taro_012669 [Colocasia esculenta]|uniref:Uncharacterized protein n=1 Tax=Colocasia esculenta TaxID=4460 RepID=A0A843UDQ7_COLES|nr:hypothetical protein [Colocasia esculenta]
MVSVDESVLDRAARERWDSFVWLLRRVFFSSPGFMAALLLLLLAEYVTSAAEMNGSTAGAFASFEEKSKENERSVGSALENIRTGDYLNWFDIGIEEGSLEQRQHEREETCVDRRYRAYVRAIAEGGANSLILCNYAQFLYRVAHDHESEEVLLEGLLQADRASNVQFPRKAYGFQVEAGGKGVHEQAMLLLCVQHKNGVNLHGYCTASSLLKWREQGTDVNYYFDVSELIDFAGMWFNTHNQRRQLLHDHDIGWENTPGRCNGRYLKIYLGIHIPHKLTSTSLEQESSSTEERLTLAKEMSWAPSMVAGTIIASGLNTSSSEGVGTS